MPTRPKVRCGTRGCRELTDNRYCPEHKKIAQHARRQAWEKKARRIDRGPSPYKSTAWRKLRAVQLARHPLCVTCGERGKLTAATDVDHVVPHAGDPEKFWDPDNLQSLCHSCHSSKTQREVNERRFSVH